MRLKKCTLCHNAFDTMYRVQYKLPKKWTFVCKECLLKVKPDNEHYRYGGTWKK